MVQVVIHSRSAFSDAEGTYIKEDTDMMEEAVITGIAHDTSEMKFTIRGVPDITGVAAKVFSALAGNNVNVDMIIQNTSQGRHHRHQLHVPRGRRAPRLRDASSACLPDIRAPASTMLDEDIAKVSLVGTGMKSSPGVAARAFSTLGGEQHQHPGHLHVAHPLVRGGGRRRRPPLRCAACTRPSSLDSDSVFEETQLSAEEIAAKMNKGR